MLYPFQTDPAQGVVSGVCAGLFDGGPADRRPEEPAGNRTRLHVRYVCFYLRLRKMPTIAFLSGRKSEAGKGSMVYELSKLAEGRKLQLPSVIQISREY